MIAAARNLLSSQPRQMYWRDIARRAVQREQSVQVIIAASNCKQPIVQSQGMNFETLGSDDDFPDPQGGRDNGSTVDLPIIH